MGKKRRALRNENPARSQRSNRTALNFWKLSCASPLRTQYFTRLALEQLEPRLVLSANFVISEFLASNNNGIVDQDGDHSDWIEITNTGDTAGSVNGYYLTDSASNLTDWRLPNVTVAAGSQLLVFASGKNRDVAGSELHTDFKLGADGEFLALRQARRLHAGFGVQPFSNAESGHFVWNWPTQHRGNVVGRRRAHAIVRAQQWRAGRHVVSTRFYAVGLDQRHDGRGLCAHRAGFRRALLPNEYVDGQSFRRRNGPGHAVRPDQFDGSQRVHDQLFGNRRRRPLR